MNFTLKIWRQANRTAKGHFVDYNVSDISPDASFLEMLDDLHLGEWNKKYDNPYVLDGTQWELTLEFSNGRRKVCFYGSNKYPWCFDKLTEFFGCYDDGDKE